MYLTYWPLNVVPIKVLTLVFMDIYLVLIWMTFPFKEFPLNVIFLLLLYFILFYFSVAPGFEALKDQNICNKIMAKLIQNYNNIFETNTDREDYAKEEASPIIAEVRYTHRSTGK